MKFSHLLTAITLLCSAAVASAQPKLDAPCQAKYDSISRDIDAATAAGNKQQLRGLERARKEVVSNCSEAKLQAERQGKVKGQEKKVAERQRDLAKAQQEGKADKIASRQKKLDEEQAELQRLKDAPL